MRVYTVYGPPETAAPPDHLETLVFVKEGFCWPAFFIAPLWLVFHRLWLGLLLWLAMVAALVLAGDMLLAPPAAIAVAALFAFAFALEANELRRWTLDRRGWRFFGIAAGRSLAEAEHRFFVALLHAPSGKTGRLAAPRAAAAKRAPASAHGPASRGAPPPVIGHFPQPGSA